MERTSAVSECIIRALIYSSNYGRIVISAVQFQRESVRARKSPEIGS